MATPNASPALQRRATRYARAAPTPMSRFGGFTAVAAPRRSPASTASVHARRIERADDENCRGEHEHHRRVVRHRRQPERLWEELLAEALLIAVDEEWDRRERRDRPEERRPVAEQASPDPAREVVDTEERDGPRTSTWSTTSGGSACTYVGPVTHMIGVSA